MIPYVARSYPRDCWTPLTPAVIASAKCRIARARPVTAPSGYVDAPGRWFGVARS